MAGANFIQLLEILSDVLIQDSVLLIEKYEHPLFINNSVFKSETYLQYASKSMKRIEQVNLDQPAHVLIKKAMPKLVDYIKLHYDSSQASLLSYKDEVNIFY